MSKEWLKSHVNTFVSSFIVAFAGTVALVPADTLLNWRTWLVAAILGAVNVGVRAMFKTVNA
jgi:hypothetical protein